MHELRLRHAGAQDAETLAANNCAMALETEGKKLDEPTVDAGVRAALGDPARGFYLIAERGGHPVGQLMVTSEWSDWRNGTFWWIQSVYVRPEARRSGVYRALHAHVLDEARRRSDVCGVRLYVARDNQGAQTTYRAVGMHQADYEMYEVDFVLPRA